MSLINGYSCGRTGYGFHRIVVVLACLLVHLALFQLVDASTQSTSSSELSISLGNGNYNATQRGGIRGQAVIASVPEEDRGMFVLYHLAKAFNSIITKGKSITLQIKVESEIPQKKSLTFKDIWTYKTFPADLLNWTMRTFGWSQSDVYSYLMRRNRVLCTSKGLCFNPNDIGSMCCPF